MHPLLNSLEQIQYEAARIITGTWKGTNTNKLYEELGLESLSDRRWGRRLTQFYKMHTYLTPPYLSGILPPKRCLLYGKTNPNIYERIRCKSTRYRNSYLPDSVDSWNNLSFDFQECKSLSIFKQKINTFIRPIPKLVFEIHNPKGLKCLFQLRVGLSPLRYDKKRHNFADTLSDICECGVAPEDISHFLFFCSNFQAQRDELMNQVIPILQKHNLMQNTHNPRLFLYGNKSISYSDNKNILLSTIEYIQHSGKFGT